MKINGLSIDFVFADNFSSSVMAIYHSLYTINLQRALIKPLLRKGGRPEYTHDADHGIGRSAVGVALSLRVASDVILR